MTTRLSNTDREQVKDWLDNYPAATEPSYRLTLPQPNSFLTFNERPNSSPFRGDELVELRRERVQFGGKWWQWVAMSMPDGEPVVFGKLRGVPYQPVHPAVQKVKTVLMGQILSYEDAAKIKRDVESRVRP